MPDRFRPCRARQHRAVRGDREQPVARAATLVAESVGDGVVQAHRNRRVPKELDAGGSRSRTDRVDPGADVRVADRQRGIPGGATRGDHEIHAEARQTENVAHEARERLRLVQVRSTQRGVGVHAQPRVPQRTNASKRARERPGGSGDRVVHGGGRALEADLRGVEPGSREPPGEAPIDSRPVRDQVDAEPQPLGVADPPGQLVAQGRLAAGEAHGGSLGVAPDRPQDPPDLEVSHLRPVPARPAGAVAARVAEHAAQVAAVGDRDLGQHRKRGRIALGGPDLDRPGDVDLIQLVAEGPAHLGEEARHVAHPFGIATDGVEHLADRRPVEQRGEQGRAPRVELANLVGPADQDGVALANEDVGPDVAGPLVHPREGRRDLARPHPEPRGDLPQHRHGAHQCDPPLTQAEWQAE